MSRTSVLLVIIILGCIFSGSKCVYAMDSSGFVTEELSEDERELFLNNVNISMLNTEPRKAPIVCFDVNQNGMIAIGTENGSNKIICVYSENGIFQYGYRYETYGSFRIEWDNEIVNIYDVRSDVSISINPAGKIENILKICNTSENNSYWNQLDKATSRKVGDYQYVLKNNIGFMGIFASTYSQLYKVDNHGNKLLIYDVNSFQFFRILIYFVGIAVFASIVIIGVIKEFKKAQRENVNGL